MGRYVRMKTPATKLYMNNKKGARCGASGLRTAPRSSSGSAISTSVINPGMSSVPTTTRGPSKYLSSWKGNRKYQSGRGRQFTVGSAGASSGGGGEGRSAGGAAPPPRHKNALLASAYRPYPPP